MGRGNSWWECSCLEPPWGCFRDLAGTTLDGAEGCRKGEHTGRAVVKLRRSELALSWVASGKLLRLSGLLCEIDAGIGLVAYEAGPGCAGNGPRDLGAFITLLLVVAGVTFGQVDRYY